MDNRDPETLDLAAATLQVFTLAHASGVAGVFVPYPPTELTKHLLADSCAKQMIESDSLTVHAERGSSMMSNSEALLFGDLGVIKSHSRLQVSNDNPYSGELVQDR